MLDRMTHRSNKPLVWLLSVLMLGASARAVRAGSAANPYQSIPAANVFRLQPIGVRSPDFPPVPLPKIILVGITTFPDRKAVLLKVRLPASPGEQAKEWSCILTEGQRAGPVEVLQIDEKAGSTKVNNSGTVMLLTFEKDGPVLRTTPPPPVPARPVILLR